MRRMDADGARRGRPISVIGKRWNSDQKLFPKLRLVFESDP
jgi:hypothetical protein